jgi:alpha-L-fucosidase
MRKAMLVGLLAMMVQQGFGQKKYEANWASIDARPVPAWFEDAKFGIFIHWGLFSVPSWAPNRKDTVGIYERYAEWYWKGLTDQNRKSHSAFKKFHEKTFGKDFKYQDFAKDFKCEFFEPNDWADVFENAGAKYVVLTSKHHEGYTLWPNKNAWNWNSVDLNPHRDLAGDLMGAVRKKGLRMGYYYSLYEWFNPLYKDNVDQYVDQHMIPQMKDLVTRYKPDLLWTDGEWDHPSERWKSTTFLSWLFNDSVSKDDIVINDRWGKETRSKHGGIYTTEYDLVHDQGMSADNTHPWEECRGIGSSFGYNRNESLDDYSSSQELINILIDKVARGGNLLLNIGPTADGRIPVIMQQRLRDMGNWLKINGEAIYGTRKWAKSPKVDGKTKVFFTKKGDDLYVLTTAWQDNLSIEGIANPSNVSLVGYAGSVKSSYKNGKLSVIAPVVSPANVPCQYAWVYKLAGAAK